MKHLVVLAALIAVSTQTASAEHAQTLLEIRYKSDVAASTKELQIYSSGAYTLRTFNADGTVASVIRTGLDNTEMAQVRSALRDAPWDITYTRIACFAYDPSYTQYVVRGKLVYTAQSCSGAMIDDVSRQSIATIEKLIANN
jgi:hypothetical protein